MRVTAAFCRLLRLEGVWVRRVAFEPGRVVVWVALRRRRLVCAHCAFSTSYRENVQGHESAWRHLDLGVWRLEIRATLRRIACPVHGVHVEGVPFAREGARFSRDFEDLVAWLATKTDRSTICRLVRIDWQTVGRIIARVGQEKLDPDRLNDLFDIGIDEVAWRSGHRFLTLVTDHQAGKVVWGAPGRSSATADRFFAELDPPQPDVPGEPEAAPQSEMSEGMGEAAQPDSEPAADQVPVGKRAAGLRAISLDMGPGYAKSARKHAPQAVICIDPFHVVKLGNEALDEVRRDYWNQLRSAGEQQAAKRFKGARWVLLKNPADHTNTQAATLRRLRNAGGAVWLAYTLKEALREIFTAGLGERDVAALLRRFCTRAARSRLASFVRLGRTITKHREGILAAVRLNINNARVEALNNKVRLITRRAYGFHTPQAALALIHLTCGPITLTLPHESPST
jgi:transposase